MNPAIAKKPMKRWLLLIPLLVATFAAGFCFAWYFMVVRTTYDEQRFRSSIKAMRQRIYGVGEYDIEPGKSLLAGFDPAKTKGSITFITSSAFSNRQHRLELKNNGDLYSQNGDDIRLVTNIGHDRCKDFFHDFLSSGILNYSQGTVALKKDLNDSGWRIEDGVFEECLISIPELGIEKRIEISNPDFELEHYPDIIEFQIFCRFEKEIFALVPPNDPLRQK